MVCKEMAECFWLVTFRAHIRMSDPTDPFRKSDASRRAAFRVSRIYNSNRKRRIEKTRTVPIRSWIVINHRFIFLGLLWMVAKSCTTVGVSGPATMKHVNFLGFTKGEFASTCFNGWVPRERSHWDGTIKDWNRAQKMSIHLKASMFTHVT